MLIVEDCDWRTESTDAFGKCSQLSVHMEMSRYFTAGDGHQITTDSADDWIERRKFIEALDGLIQEEASARTDGHSDDNRTPTRVHQIASEGILPTD